MKSLEKLNLIQKVFEKLADWHGYDLSRLDKDYETNFDLDFCAIEKELTAFDIIKKKRVDLEYLKCCENYEQYKTVCSYWNEISKKQFDLLKEVLL